MTKYLIDFVNDATEEQINEYIDAVNGTIVTEYDAFEKLYLIDAPEFPQETDIIDAIVLDENNPVTLLGDVIYMDQNIGKVATDGSLPIITLDTALEKNWWKMYSFSSPDLEAPSYTTNRRGKGSVIYLMDSGIDIGHDEFSESDVENLFTFTGNFIDANGHGTALASVMVGKTCGITDATVKSVKIFEKGTPTMLSDMMAALDAIFADRQANEFEHYIVNISWAIPKNTFVESKLRQFMQNGIFVVCAAGNSGEAIGDVTPASMPEVLTIGSYNQSLQPSDFTDYTGSAISCTQNCTNTGELDGFAPGERIWTALPDGGYNFAAGTSLSAAIESAALAYNFATGYYPPMSFMDISEHLYHRRVGLGRRDLLDLSDPRYASSNNQITTFFDQRQDYDNIVAFFGNFRMNAESIFIINFVNPQLVKSVEFDSPLPSYVLVQPNGKISIDATDITADYTKLVLPLTLTYNDGTEEKHDLEIYIVEPTLIANEVEDEELKIILSTVEVPGCTSQPFIECQPVCGVQNCSFFKFGCACDF